MTYQESLQYLNSFIDYEKRDSYDYAKSFRLDRMRCLASSLGDPQKEIRSIHVAGTKGKGSTSAMIYSILKAAGFRVGLYTSPHLISFRERVRINDTLISEEEVSSLLGQVKTAVDGLGVKDDPPTFFELYTALACLYFKRERVDFAVYEVGLGGRLDATNIIEPLVSVITPISYEHMHILGNTLSKIASEKAGIIKNGGISVTAPQEKEALEVIENICKEKNARLIIVGKDIQYRELIATDSKEAFSVSGMFGKYENLETGLLGSHQAVNAATAIGAVEALRLREITVPADAIKKGIRTVRWEGRLEVVKRRPYIVLDGAQNKASAAALAGAVRKIFKYRKSVLVLGVSRDKDISGILKELLPIADSVILTKSKVAERALEPLRIKELIRSKNIIVTSGVEEALDKAASKAAPDDLILVTGSLFIVGEARHILKGETLRELPSSTA